MKSCEYDVRSCVVSVLLKSGIGRKNIRIEIPLDTASSNGRADIVVLLQDNKIGCIELKSGKDKFCKDAIKEQTAVYRRVFDYCAVIVDKIHKKETMEACKHGARLKSNWGLVTAEYCHERKTIGEDCGRFGWQELPNPAYRIFEHASSLTCVYDMLNVLWASDIGSVKYRTIIKWRQEMNLIQAREKVSKALLERPLNKWEEKFWKQFDNKETML